MNWEKNVRTVIPYVPGEQPKKMNVIKLNTNENPYPPSPKAVAAIQEIDPREYTKYPDPEALVLREALAKYHGLKTSQVFVGVGSDDVLSMAFLTFFNGEKPILFPDITYSFYDVWADLYRIPYELCPLRDDFSIDPNDYMRANGGIVIANPNAPTGRMEDPAMIEGIVQANPDSVVIVDEAYVDFGGVSALPLIERYENVLVVQTFSKSRAMAGMRIGMAFGSEKLIRYLNDVKFSFNSYTMNAPTLHAGAASIEDDAYFKEQCAKVIATRERTKKALAALGFSFADSKTNFIFATHKSVPAAEIFAALREQGIYVRYFKKPRIDNYLRISIGTDEEMDTVLNFLEKYLDGR